MASGWTHPRIGELWRLTGSIVVAPCGDEASRPFRSYRLCPELLVHTTDLEPVNEAR